MSDRLFTVLLPVHRPPDLLPYAVRSVLAQTFEDFELFIVCDGAPAATAAAARAFAEADKRIRVFVHPKGERNGEAWRHMALQQASGRYVCQIGDDDLWFDNHLAEACKLMETADFGNLLAIQILADDGGPNVQLADLALPAVRQSMIHSRYNFFGPTSAVYSRQAYCGLPVGWSPAPADVWSDLFMWRKFLVRPEVRCASRQVPTSLMFPASVRTAVGLDHRRAEIDRYAARIGDPAFRDELWRGALGRLADQMIGLRLQAVRQSAANQAAEAKAARMLEALAQILASEGDTDAQTRLARAAMQAEVQDGI